MVVDELPAIVRVQPQEGEEQALAQVMDRAAHPLLAFAPHPLALHPTGGYVNGAQGIQIESLGALTAVGHQSLP